MYVYVNFQVPTYKPPCLYVAIKLFVMQINLHNKPSYGYSIVGKFGSINVWWKPVDKDLGKKSLANE